MIKTWHLVLLLVITIVGIGIIDVIRTTQKEYYDYYMLEELDIDRFQETISSGTSCILFYEDESDVCKEMENNLGELKSKINDNIKFYKLNIDNYPGQYKDYKITGIPSTLIYKEGQEIKRIMGLIPTSNLDMIIKRIEL